MNIRFWGVRGSIVTPGKEYVRYGGNTPCVEVFDDEGRLIVLDAGIGITRLFSVHAQRREFNILLSHTHWDHIQGLPYFPPMFFPGTRITIHAGRINVKRLGTIIAKQFSANYSPFKSIQALASMLDFQRLPVSGPIGGFNIRTCRTNHPANACAIRVENTSSSMVYVPDHEASGDKKINQCLVRLCRGADLLVHDAQYTPEEIDRRRGWGHSTWLEAVDNARAAGVKKLALFHYDLSHDDRTVKSIEKHAIDYSKSVGGPEVIASSEGLCLKL